MRRLVAVGVLVLGWMAGNESVYAAPYQCSTRIHHPRAASGMCYAGTGYHRVGVRVYYSALGGRYYNAYGPWRHPDNASAISVPSGHQIISAWNSLSG
jgi:hypothetical protein